jgi:lysophospholipase L1-like esterase
MAVTTDILDVNDLGDIYPRGLSGRKVLFIGDSITNGSNASNAVFAFPNQACLQAGTLLFPVALRVVRGFPGERTDQIAARLLGDIQTYDPDIVVFSGGTNDAIQGAALSVYAASITAVSKLCRDRSIPFVIVNVPPMLSTASAISQRSAVAMNLWASLNVPSLGGVIADVWTALVNFANGALATGYVSGVDEVHPNNLGHSRMAKFVAAAMIAAAKAPVYASVVGQPPANLITNGLMTGTIGGAPTGWAVRAGGVFTFGDAATAAIVAASASGPYYGQMLEIDLNATTQNSQHTQEIQIAAAKYAANDLIMAQWYQEQELVSGGDFDALPVAGNGAGVKVLNNSTGAYITQMTLSAGLSGYQQIIWQGPATNPNMGFELVVTANTGRRIKGRIGQVGVVNLTQMGLASLITG